MEFHHYNTIQVNFDYSQRESAEYRDLVTKTMQHELGHLIARHSEYGYSSQEWYDAIVKDGTFTYGNIRTSEDDRHYDIEQDFAETVAIYLTTYRGFYNDPYINTLEPATDYRHRFAILDRIMGIDEMKNAL